MTLLAPIVETWRRVSATASRTAKVRELADALRRLSADEVEIAARYLAGETRQGKLGIGHALLVGATGQQHAPHPLLDIGEVDRRLTAIARIAGKGAIAARTQELNELFTRATQPEAEFLYKLLIGELRQGALEGVMLDAIATASGIPPGEVRRAAMYGGNLGVVARVAFTEGAAGLETFRLQLLSPIAPMLAQTADDVTSALELLGGRAAFEWKLDGARIQVHKSGETVRIYTRSLNDVTAAAPEIVRLVAELPLPELVLDGEAIALAADGSPRPFQITMRRFGRKLDVESLRHELPLSAFFFDCLAFAGRDLTQLPAAERFAVLDDTLPPGLQVQRLITADPRAARAFYEDAITRGHEGVMAKALDSPYAAGSRGASWLKIKRAHTLDLVVLAAEWGHGRRTGRLSNLHLGAMDTATGEWVMLGKTFKGLTDALLEWQTTEFLARAVHRDAHTVYLRPELVVEIVFNDLQASSQYPGGLALRFARVKGYRPDKTVREADTLDTVRAIYRAQQRAERAADGR